MIWEGIIDMGRKKEGAEEGRDKAKKESKVVPKEGQWEREKQEGLVWRFGRGRGWGWSVEIVL